MSDSPTDPNGAARPPRRSDPLVEQAMSWLAAQHPDLSGRRLALAAQMAAVASKMLHDGADLGQIKLVASAIKEVRHAYRVFNRFRGVRKASIYGSARTPPDHPDYRAASEFGHLIAAQGWMAITGAGNGIMKAGHEGPKREASFGLSINLPFETNANEYILGDAKLINFRYFFTRKLMFVSHADAFAVFPGGFGTQDELFESLTLIQTGKSPIVPIVLVEGEGGDYWRSWETHIRHDLLRHGWISPEDIDLYRVCATPQEAVDEILAFYRVYHSSRMVGPRLVLRLQHEIAPVHLEALKDEFSPLLAEGGFEQSGMLDGENAFPELPRLHFVHNRRHFGMLRRLINRLNTLEPA
ncbi:MAG: TIGR00730 family Rossman fold protein [Phycisphaerales bacterium]